MVKWDITGIIGVAMIVIGFGGGYEMMLLLTALSMKSVELTGGQEDPGMVAHRAAQAMIPLLVGVPIGMFGIILVFIALRGYCLLAANAPRRIE